jgi:hypothetical protein
LWSRGPDWWREPKWRRWAGRWRPGRGRAWADGVAWPGARGLIGRRGRWWPAPRRTWPTLFRPLEQKWRSWRRTAGLVSLSRRTAIFGRERGGKLANFALHHKSDLTLRAGDRVHACLRTKATKYVAKSRRLPPAARNLGNRPRLRPLLCASCPEVGRTLRPDLLAKQRRRGGGSQAAPTTRNPNSASRPAQANHDGLADDDRRATRHSGRHPLRPTERDLTHRKKSNHPSN